MISKPLAYIKLFYKIKYLHSRNKQKVEVKWDLGDKQKVKVKWDLGD